LTDESVEGDETVVVSLEPSSLAAPKPGFASAIIVLEDAPFDAWRARSFPPGQSGEDAVSGPHADPDHDGASNLLEWALGTAPTNANGNVLSVTITEGSLLTSTTRRRNLPADTLAWEFSADAVQWQVPSPGPTLVAIEELSPEVDRLTWQWPASATAPAFARLRVTP
jgi:hypothetical protein